MLRALFGLALGLGRACSGLDAAAADHWQPELAGTFASLLPAARALEPQMRDLAGHLEGLDTI